MSLHSLKFLMDSHSFSSSYQITLWSPHTAIQLYSVEIAQPVEFIGAVTEPWCLKNGKTFQKFILNEGFYAQI